MQMITTLRTNAQVGLCVLSFDIGKRLYSCALTVVMSSTPFDDCSDENGMVTGWDAGRTESAARAARTSTASASALVRVRAGAVAF